jgi:diaminopimelate decarboxylase
MFELAEHFPNLKYLDMGSGFKVPYQDGDLETDVKSLGKKSTQQSKNTKKLLGKNSSFGLNLGNSWLVKADIFGKI